MIVAGGYQSLFFWCLNGSQQVLFLNFDQLSLAFVLFLRCYILVCNGNGNGVLQ
ncbi:hypothetical protein Hanom_Chr03g00278881 [Helianthus anomalus]